MTNNYANPAHRGISLMRNSYHQIHGYGRNPGPANDIDFTWYLPVFPRLPEELLIRACDGLRHLGVTYKVCAAWLLYINQTSAGPRWELLFPNQTHDASGGNVRLDLRGIIMPQTARVAGTIASVTPEEFADSGPSLLPTDGLSILIDTSRDWIVARGLMIVAGVPEPVQMNHVIWPTFIEHDEIAKHIFRREAD